MMRRALQALAAVVAVAGLAIWAIQGASLGWTKTRVPVKTLDEITEIEKIEWREQFLPGVDFLGGALLGAGALAGASLLLGRKKPTEN